MSKLKVKFKGKKLLADSGLTLYRVTKDGDVNYTTVHRWLNNEGSRGLSSDVLIGFLKGLGYSTQELKELPLGDIFDIT